ncbi:MAG: B12-binding domain-containing radical SAM protein [Candidatus Zambryskibacteria bacterium]|nr:B12-binding domain-containing radical SAM protein [Candidatus Zambryskibacteria bacterium]
MKNIQLHEFNILMDKKVYLPNVSGMLQAYAVGVPEVVEHFHFSQFQFIRKEPEKIADEWDNPSVLAFSSSMWNHELNLVLARLARERFPDSLIVFGGPHVPDDHRAELFLKEHPFVDITVLSEGEITFAEVLKTLITSRDFSTVRGLVFRDRSTGRIVRTPDRPLVDINFLPSPYLSGLYDRALERRGDMEFQVIFETNRGCPFHCSFCAWGNSITKVRFFNFERLAREIEWLGEKEISFVFGADANFGMFPRDKEIAEMFAEVKRRYSHPRSFRVCYGKNATDRIYEVAQILETNHLTTGVTLSFQSTDPDTLKIIHRDNIKVDTYRELLKLYRRDGIRVYTELILGLPGETYESFKKGIEEVFQAGLYDQVGIFLCQVLPNTPMYDPEYVKLHGIETRCIELVETHASKRRPGEVAEYEDVVVATRSMPHPEWRRSATLMWMAQTLHGLKLGFFVSLYLFREFGLKYTELFEYLIANGTDTNRFPIFSRELNRYAEYLEGIMTGKPQCVFLPEYGKISWQVEEATFLRLSGDFENFYQEFKGLTQSFLEERGVMVPLRELNEVFKYQYARIAAPVLRQSAFEFLHTVPEYFKNILLDKPATLKEGKQTVRVERTDYRSDKEEFARQVIWFGRRDSRAVEPATWS